MNRQLSVRRWRPSATTKKSPQFLEKLLLVFTFIICREPFQSSGDQRSCPATIEDSIFTTRRTMSLEKRLRIFDLLFMQRKKILSAATFERPFAVGSVRKEIFQGSKQKRTEPALLPIDASVYFVFDQVSEKALRQILRIMHGVSAAAHETVKRRPIGLAKLGQCGLRNLRIGLASPRRENRAPVSGRKQTTLARSVSREG